MEKNGFCGKQKFYHYYEKKRSNKQILDKIPKIVFLKTWYQKSYKVSLFILKEHNLSQIYQQVFY